MFDLNHVIEQIQKDKGIPREVLVEAIEQAMLSAARKKLGMYGELEAHFNPEVGEVELFQFKTVAEEVADNNLQMTVEHAHTLDAEATIGDSLGEKIDSRILGRIAAQSAKQVIIQKLRDAERDIVVGEYESKLGAVISGIVRRIEKGHIIVDLNKTEGIIFHREQSPSEAYKPGDRIQSFLYEIDTKARGPMLLLSRRHPNLVVALFEMEVPEISEEIVVVKSVAREPGVRSKIAVYSTDGDVDPVGACVGMKGSRVQSVVQELRGEKIDIVLWDPDIARFVCNAIAPAQVAKVIVLDKKHSLEVIVPDDQLSLSIGRKGQNVRLAAELTGWNIDVFSESRVEELAKMAKEKLVADLGISDAMSTVLYSHAFRTSEEIAETPAEDFLKIPGLDGDALKVIYAKARSVSGYHNDVIDTEDDEAEAPAEVNAIDTVIASPAMAESVDRTAGEGE